MINETYKLSCAMEKASVKAESWHRKYKPIPNANAKAPCVRILIGKNSSLSLSAVPPDQAAGIRKYGTNQGTFPGMNLCPLYRVTDDNQKKLISDIISGKTLPPETDTIQALCIQNNWGSKFRKKLAVSIQDTPNELKKFLSRQDCPAASTLIENTARFQDANQLRQSLQTAIFNMLLQKKDTALALQVLFHLGDEKKLPENDNGTLSVIWDSETLIEMGTPSVGERFTRQLNSALIAADEAQQASKADTALDAFRFPFPGDLDEPMPSVKLAGGFDATLRTMFHGQPCQTRYGKIESGSYPISPQMRSSLQDALSWISSTKQKGITWTNTDKGEILFAYPESLPDVPISFIDAFKRTFDENNQAKRFEASAETFISGLAAARKPGTDPASERIQFFILRKIDRARTKVVYSYNTNAREIEKQSEALSLGCQNLPRFLDGQPFTLFPLEIADVMNRVWKQDATLTTDKFKPCPAYHGMKLFFGDDASLRDDLGVLVRNTTVMAPTLGKMTAGAGEQPAAFYKKVKQALALMGLILYRLHIKKEVYMTEFPYQLGQLLNACDSLHALYCECERKGAMPGQFAGSGLYVAASEFPYRTLAQLAQRMHPYITWAKTYRYTGKDKSGLAGWFLSIYEKIAEQLYAVWNPATRLTDEEKAQLFIGFLAALPNDKKENDSKK